MFSDPWAGRAGPYNRSGSAMAGPCNCWICKASEEFVWQVRISN
jgi:hypothetical protein